MAAADDLRPLVDASAALLRATAHIAGQGSRRILGAPVRPVVAELGRQVPARTSARRFAVLLEQALTQSSAEAEDLLLDALVRGLVPDEARIIAALAGRAWSPLVHVEARRDGEEHLGLRNASLIGRQAGIALVRRTPHYVTRLLATGLVVATAEREDRGPEYEVLLAEPDVLDAIRGAGRGPLGPRIRRGGLELSDLGRELWAAQQTMERVVERSV
ncbi:MULTISPECIES: Abi-alpha family protein [unclassified Nocardioides]|uniref:Abi-alpha family protein n=1 Tax=unclassified Nocardioides TaxID=2615069 RepID=UPI0006FE126E|nr:MULTISPECIES: hypothetical protein [unclassified Nocardioides]KRA37722.1 hypothetical protein ASD81_03225 [Nocardioides sp. Root614]KRA91682.1 hypothetical protein ASD84_03490 [Nocardioides sp. Root682]